MIVEVQIKISGGNQSNELQRRKTEKSQYVINLLVTVYPLVASICWVLCLCQSHSFKHLSF